MSRPTIRDLANAAGVSIATANRVLAGSASVKPGTTQRVKDVAHELGFIGIQAVEGNRGGKVKVQIWLSASSDFAVPLCGHGGSSSDSG
ncbi:LacI family DNA-binding transcriptional regulator [Pararhizobium sp. LjRoot235]|uniref:LacI family DNA-binding transcriptional regulator n=1 Tax=Pararhizobium sp. LjRoot235 TaxID=3342291 RepID=UPI003F509383